MPNYGVYNDCHKYYQSMWPEAQSTPQSQSESKIDINDSILNDWTFIYNKIPTFKSWVLVEKGTECDRSNDEKLKEMKQNAANVSNKIFTAATGVGTLAYNFNVGSNLLEFGAGLAAFSKWSNILGNSVVAQYGTAMLVGKAAKAAVGYKVALLGGCSAGSIATAGLAMFAVGTVALTGTIAYNATCKQPEEKVKTWFPGFSYLKSLVAAAA